MTIGAQLHGEANTDAVSHIDRLPQSGVAHARDLGGRQLNLAAQSRKKVAEVLSGNPADNRGLEHRSEFAGASTHTLERLFHT